MAITQDVLLESLSVYPNQVVLGAQQPFCFRGLRILQAGIGEWSRDVLYLGRWEDLDRWSAPIDQECCFVIVSPTNNPVWRVRPENLILISGEIEWLELVNHILGLFAQLDDYEERLRRAMRKRSDYSAIFEVAREMFPNCPVVLSDSGYNVLYASHTSNEVNENVDSVLRQGYYDKKTTDDLARSGYFDRVDRYLEPNFVREHTNCGVPIGLKVFENNGLRYAFVICYFVDHQPTKKDEMLFAYFAEQLEEFCRAANDFSNFFPTQQQYVNDLIEHADQFSEGYLRNRCEGLHIPVEGNFQLGIIQLDEFVITKAVNLFAQLRTWLRLPYYKVIQYQQSIILLLKDQNALSLKERMDSDEQWKAFQETLIAYRARVGLSSGFSSIVKFGVAYRQAAVALRQGKRMAPEKVQYDYLNYYVYDMLECYTQKFELADICASQLKRLAAENERESDNLILLKTYLAEKQNISATAQKIHMHRNSVIYRLQKIQNILGMNLEDEETRLHLHLSFKVLEMQGDL